MRVYSYVARDNDGKRQEGQRQAMTRQDLYGWLRQQKLVPISIQEMEEEPERSPIRYAPGKKIKSIEVSDFCWQLATMLEGGVPLIEAVVTLSEDIENAYLRIVLQNIVENMQAGQTFADSLRPFSDVFDPIFLALIAAGESGGALTTTLQRLGHHYSEKDKIGRKVKTAMSYPIFVVTFIILILVAVMTFIIPRFLGIFEQMEGELPVFTQVFIQGYNFTVANLHWGLCLIGMIVIGSMFWHRTNTGHRQFSYLALRLPLFGQIIKQSFVVIFCRTLSTLLSNGVSVLEAFQILAGMTRNDVIRDAISKTHDQILQGSNISTSMAATEFFPRLTIKMAQVGEESGAIAQVMDRTSEHFERKVDSAISSMTSVLEPALIVTVGAIVLFIVLALYLPIFSMTEI